MTTQETVYNGRDNTIDLLLKADGIPQDLSSVTRMILLSNDGTVTIDSDLVPSAFDWNLGETGKVVLSLGDQSIASGAYVCTLFVFDPTNNDGIYWGEIVLQVLD